MSQPVTGTPAQVAETTHRIVGQLIGANSNVKEAYVGIASNGDQGVQDRMNAKYAPKGYTDIQQIYTTTSDNYRKEVEKDLVDHLEGNEKLGNQVGGGGGPIGTPMESVYLATKEYKEPPQHIGPNGGQFYYNSNGNPTYGNDGVYEGPRGGRYAYTESGNKEYL